MTARLRRLTAASAALASLLGSALAQQDFSGVEIRSSEVAPGIFMLEGAGGNMGLSVGPEGAFLIDDQFAPLSEKIIAAIGAITPEPVAFVVNTHWHGDHVGGNAAFDRAGAHIVAHENVRRRLQQQATGQTNSASAVTAGLPVITFADAVAFHWNGLEIAVRHLPGAHTDGDSVVSFDGGRVVHMGDLFMNGFFAYIDLDSGGDLDGYIAAQDAVLASLRDDAILIPGHGPVATKADLVRTQAMLKDVRTRIKALIDQGFDENRAVAARPLADLEAQWANSFMSADRMTRIAYRSLKR